MIRRLLTVTSTVLALALFGAGTAGASVFDYYRNNTLINGQFRGVLNSQTYMNWLRAGSGSGTNACATNNWIPVGTYQITFHNDNYDGSLIKGRVWRLTDYQCSNGVRRTELFVHSEETAAQGQSCPSFCWDSTNDYYSNGCVKIARLPVGADGKSDLGRVDYFVHTYGAAANLSVFA
jgi:hypothetical protein